MVKLLALCFAVFALVGCNRGGKENSDAVRQGVLDYLAGRSNLSLAAMNVQVTSVTFKGDQADAIVSFTPKGSPSGQGMSIRYALERRGDRWVVKQREDAGGLAHQGAVIPNSGANPHAGGAMPGAGAPSRMPGELPPPPEKK